MPPKTTHRSLVLACILLAMFMAAIEATIVATAMPEIGARLGDFALYSWVFAAFLLSQTATTVLFGKLADLYGRRPVLVFGIVVFLVGSVLCGFATTMPVLIGFRLLQGIGAGSIMPVATTIVGDLYTPAERASVQGYLASVWGISAILGPLAGGLIVERFSWPWVFWINVPIGLLAIVGLYSFLHEGVERKKHSVDYSGALLFAIAISAFMLLVTQYAHMNAVMILITATVFVACLGGFIWNERRVKEPILNLEVWTDRVIASGNAAVLAAGMVLIGLTSFLAVYVQGVMGRTPTVAGLALTMMAVGWPVASVLSRKFYSRLTMRGTLRLGSVLMLIGASVLLFLQPDSGPVMAGVGSLIIGFGMGLLNITVLLLVQGSVDWSRRGSATASNVFSRNLGSTLGAAVLGGVLNYGLTSFKGVSAEQVPKLLAGGQIDPLVRQALHHGLQLTFRGVFLLAIITVAVALLIPNRHLHQLSGG